MANENEEKEFTPPKKSFTHEFFVGLFALIGCACFAYLAINIAGMKFLDAGYYNVTAEFDNISGLDKGSSVEIAGVPVGDVTSIALDGTSALITMRVREDVALRDDDIAAIRTKGIIGEKFIKISPGASEDNIAPGGRISDTDSVMEFEEVIGKLIHSLK